MKPVKIIIIIVFSIIVLFGVSRVYKIANCESIGYESFFRKSVEIRSICSVEHVTGLVFDLDTITSINEHVDQGFGDFQNNILLEFRGGMFTAETLANKKIFGKNLMRMTQEDINQSFEIKFYEQDTNSKLVLSENLLFSKIGDLNGDTQYTYGKSDFYGYEYGIVIFDLNNDLMFYAIGA